MGLSKYTSPFNFNYYWTKLVKEQVEVTNMALVIATAMYFIVSLPFKIGEGIVLKE